MELTERTSSVGLHAHLADRVKALGLPSSAQILDLGCGTGAWLKRLAEAGYYDLLGVDKNISQFGAEGLEVREGDLESLVSILPSRQFDLVTAIEVVEHPADTGQFFSGVRELLAPRGLLLCTTPNVHSLLARLRFLAVGSLPEFDEKGDPTHLRPVILPLLRRIITCHGLGLDAVWTYPERGVGSRWRLASRVVRGVARIVLADPLPGDTLCVLIRRLDGSFATGSSHCPGGETRA